MSDLNRALHIYDDISQEINIYFSSHRQRDYSATFSKLHISPYITELYSESAVNLPMYSMSVSVTMIGLVDIYLMSDKNQLNTYPAKI
jgi:hypothetical protein